MKWFCCLLLTVSSLAPLIGRAAQTAQARLYCLSLRVQQTTDESGQNTLAMTTLSAGVNGELAPTFIPAYGKYTNSTWLEFTDVDNDRYDGQLGLNLPAGTDSNGNGMPDFFESSQAVNASTTGEFSIPGLPNPSGTATAQWFRETNSTIGTCRLSLKMGFTTMTFNHTFELLEYAGALSYTPAPTNVNGTVTLTQSGSGGDQLSGAVYFVKTIDKYNQLNLLAGTLVNGSSQTLSFSNHLYIRDLSRQTNYSGTFEFFDYDPNTTDEDYFYWRLIVSDLNDADHDGIPDFSDDPSGIQPPRRPSLSLVRTSTNLLLTIRGDVGHLHQVQEATAVNSTNWPTVLSVTLTNDPQTVAMPLPTAPPRFWRAIAQ